MKFITLIVCYHTRLDTLPQTAVTVDEALCVNVRRGGHKAALVAFQQTRVLTQQ